MSKKSVLEEVSAEDCTGCGGCVGGCPFGALRLGESVDGFLVPIETGSECRDCGLCLKVCPALQPSPEAVNLPEAFAAWSTGGQVRAASASGGIFAEVARSFLERGGLVAGARYTGVGTVAHVLIDDVRDLLQLQGSKYAQSHAEGVYSLCLAELERGRNLLFSGTPCQVKAMGLLAEARGVSKGLFTADLVCYGIPSNLFIRKYLGWLERVHGSRLNAFLFRDNSLPWSSYGVSAVFDNGSRYCGDQQKDPFYRGYEIALRSSCYDCPWNRFPRPGDLTLGDFWGIAPELHDERGVSLVLENSSKGRELLQGAGGIRFFHRGIDEACRENMRVDGRRLDIPVGRNAFFEALRSWSFENVIHEFL